MPDAQEALVTVGLVVVGVIVAALIVKMGVRNNVPVLKDAAI